MTNPSFILDANCVNSRQNNGWLNNLEDKESQGLIDLYYASTSLEEASHGNLRRKNKAESFPFSESNQDDPTIQIKLNQIKLILYDGENETSNKLNDALIVLQAFLTNSPLITNDGNSKSQPKGILGCKAELANIGISVLTPEEAVLSLKCKFEPK